MSPISQILDLREFVEGAEEALKEGTLLDKLFVFANAARSPDPEALVRDACELIREHPLSSLFATSHHDREGKVIYRSEGGGFGTGENAAAIQQQIAQAESLRRTIACAAIETGRVTIVAQHFLSDEVFLSLLQNSPFVPHHLLATFSRGFLRFFQGDLTSALYVLTPLLENSLRDVLRLNGYDVTVFDDATQTQRDRTVSQLFEQMRTELDGIFGEAITTDIENIFLKQPGPHIRHALSHGLLHDGIPYGTDAIYACWLIFRLCLLPLFGHRDTLQFPFE
jgi:hypothetical protein